VWSAPSSASTPILPPRSGPQRVRAARDDAAAEPVTRAPDGSAAGSEDGHGSTAVRNGSAFEDAFRIRLAIAGSEALAAVDAEVGDVTATASLPAVDGPSELAAARDRIARRTRRERNSDTGDVRRGRNNRDAERTHRRGANGRPDSRGGRADARGT